MLEFIYNVRRYIYFFVVFFLNYNKLLLNGIILYYNYIINEEYIYIYFI
jgi:hypothetical protein